MIAIIDYDTGNTKNVQKALSYIGLDSMITDQPTEILKAKGIILPGVGAYSEAMNELEKRGLIPLLQEVVTNGKPLLGVCLGMQLLLEGSMEHGYTDGLGFISGICEKLPDDVEFPVPHMGWNELMVTKKTPLTAKVEGHSVYFVHSYFANCDAEAIDAMAKYSLKIPAMISKGNVFGVQFHPEKSGEIGLAVLKGFKEVVQ